MREINIYDLQFMDIELFLRIAEYGSFTKAGQSLFMTQSLVSKRIYTLENKLGLQLFIRNKRHVTLTPAGRILQRQLGHINDTVLKALKEAHDVQCGIRGTIRLGFLEWGNLFFMSSLEEFIKNNPQISMELNRYAFFELKKALMSTEIDMAFTISYDVVSMDMDEFETMDLIKVPLVAVMSKKNKLSAESSLTVKDLKSEPLLMVNPKYSIGYCECVNNLFALENINPIISHYAQSGGDHIGNILLNEGIVIASQNFFQDAWKDQITPVPIEDTCVSAVAIWKKSNINPALHLLIEQLKSSE
jgi:LysR family transcriptional activator of glutamate synthase operon